MAKAIVTTMGLDDEVAELVKRIGSSRNPKNYMSSYTVNRRFEGTTLVTVTFIADSGFSKAPEGTTNA